MMWSVRAVRWYRLFGEGSAEVFSRLCSVGVFCLQETPYHMREDSPGQDQSREFPTGGALSGYIQSLRLRGLLLAGNFIISVEMTLRVRASQVEVFLGAFLFDWFRVFSYGGLSLAGGFSVWKNL